MPERFRFRLDPDIAALLGPERAPLLIGTELPFRSGQESVQARIEEISFGDGGLFVTLVIDERMPGGMVAAVGADGKGIWIRVSGGPVPEGRSGIVGEGPGGQGGDHV